MGKNIIIVVQNICDPSFFERIHKTQAICFFEQLYLSGCKLVLPFPTKAFIGLVQRSQMQASSGIRNAFIHAA